MNPLQPEMTDKEEELMYRDAQNKFLGEPTIPVEGCILCMKTQRTPDEKSILSHIIGRSVLHDAECVRCLDVNGGREIKFRRLGYKGYCQSCETMLSARGEKDLNPTLHVPLVDRYNRDVVGDLRLRDGAVFSYYYYFFSVVFRVLTLNEVVLGASNEAKVVRQWLRNTRPYLLDANVSVPSASVCAIFVSVPTMDDIANWRKQFNNSYLWGFYGAFNPIFMENNSFMMQICHGPFAITCVANAELAEIRNYPADFIPVIAGQELVIPYVERGSNSLLYSSMAEKNHTIMEQEFRFNDRVVSPTAPVVPFNGSIFMMPTHFYSLSDDGIIFNRHEEAVEPQTKNNATLHILKFNNGSTAPPKDVVYVQRHSATHKILRAYWFVFPGGADLKLRIHSSVNLSLYTDIFSFADLPDSADIQTWFETMFALIN